MKSSLIVLFLFSINLHAQNKLSGTKYVYVRVEVDEPEYDAEFTKLMNYQKNYYKSNIVSYSSDIVTITGYNEEKKYRFIEKIRKQAYEEYVENYISIDKDAQRHIVSAKSYVYNSYKEASISKNGDQ